VRVRVPEPKLFDANCVDDGVLANFSFKDTSPAARRFIIGRMWYRVLKWAGSYSGQGDAVKPDNCPHTADVYSSQDVGNPAMHRAVLDIDVPAYLVPSSTDGHSHLLIDHQMTWEMYCKVMDVLAEAGILEQGYVAASKRNGASMVRLPWRQKNKARFVESTY